MFVFGLILGILGIIFCIWWIGSAVNAKDRGFAIFSLVGCFLLLLICIGGLCLSSPS
ncbi:MAG: hypothetical protein K6G71_02050 [Clostridiales bacterium]|nr:hypothetical protein [Clostridiales bacterium]